MKIFKQVDLVISATLFVSLLIIYLTNNTSFQLTLIMGTWQLISMLVHTVKHWFTHIGGYRRAIHCVFIGFILISPFGDRIPELNLLMMVFSACYIFLCYREVRMIKFKELIHLKN